MKKFLSVIVVITTLVLCFTLAACGNRYVSRYNATLMTTTNTPDKATVTFDAFSGTYVIKFENKGNDEVFITYEATLGEGNIKVYCDYNGVKLNLLEIENGGNEVGLTETFTGNKTIYVIIESDGKCKNGSFIFTLEKSKK